MANERDVPEQHAQEITCGWRRFEAGTSSRGAAPTWTFNITLSGRVQLEIDGASVVLTRGQVLIRRPGTLEHWSVPSQPAPGEKDSHWHCIYAAFTPRPHWYPWLQFPEREAGHRVWRLSGAKAARQVSSGMKRVHGYANGAHAFRAEWALHALEKVLLFYWADQRAKDVQLDPRVSRALEYLSAHATEAIKLAWLARYCHVSRSHLAYLFAKQVGVPPLQFQEGQRMERASQMLRMTIDPIKNIGFDLGFDDPHYFSRRFRKFRGVTPREYRARFQRAAGTRAGAGAR